MQIKVTQKIVFIKTGVGGWAEGAKKSKPLYEFWLIMQPPRWPERGNAGGALVFLVLLWLLYVMGLYTCVGC